MGEGWNTLRRDEVDTTWGGENTLEHHYGKGVNKNRGGGGLKISRGKRDPTNVTWRN